MWHHRNTSFVAFCFFTVLAVFLALSFTSCSGVTPTTGALSLVGRQSFEELRLKTAKGDELYVKGYNTQNPDPEFTAAAKDAANFYTGAKTLENITESTVLNPNKIPKDPNVIPKNPNVIPNDPEHIPVNPNVIPK